MAGEKQIYVFFKGRLIEIEPYKEHIVAAWTQRRKLNNRITWIIK